MKEIPLTQGKVSIVDDDMYGYLMQWKWYADRADCKAEKWYARRSEQRQIISMHRVILPVPDELEVDHKDGDGLHNWRKNLREATRKQNAQNQKPHLGNSAGFKGVYLRKNGLCSAHIGIDGIFRHLGTFDTPQDAAIAYNHAALECFGPFAYFNDIPGWELITPNRRPGFDQIRVNPKSGHKYIVWNQRHQKWEVRFPVNNQRVHLSNFSSVEEAVRAIDDYKQTSPAA